ncbi:hypothetical protein HOLleu_27100 [Holothuria leucospilota]|uniref:Ig-like domain-containing protein n=1 Tax=Holothuria leucospilota TaxID=206669 RepID=A0A9Q1BPT1_HOLLE|nr:hypothetical protein HOLleu_27100 [Holothuria leucospilota]
MTLLGRPVSNRPILLLLLSFVCSVTLEVLETCPAIVFGGLLGGNTHFNCNITDVSNAGWRRNKKEVFAGNSDLSQYDNVRVSRHNYSLFVDPIYWADEGIYQCTNFNIVVSTYCLYVTSRKPYQHFKRKRSWSYIDNKTLRFKGTTVVQSPF